LATVINDWFLARAAGQESVYRRIDYQLHIHNISAAGIEVFD